MFDVICHGRARSPMCVRKCLTSYIYLLNCQRHVLSNELKKLLVDSLSVITFNLTYALSVWCPSLTQQQQQRLQQMQNHSIWSCTGSKKI